MTIAVPARAEAFESSSSSSHSVAAHGAAIVRASRTAPPAAQAKPRCQRAWRPLRPTPSALRVVSIALLKGLLSSAMLWSTARYLSAMCGGQRAMRGGCVLVWLVRLVLEMV